MRNSEKIQTIKKKKKKRENHVRRRRSLRVQIEIEKN